MCFQAHRASSGPRDSLGCVFSSRSPGARWSVGACLACLSSTLEALNLPSCQVKPPDSSGPQLLVAGLSC